MGNNEPQNRTKKKNKVWINSNVDDPGFYSVVVLSSRDLVTGKIASPLLDTPEKQKALQEEMESEKDPASLLEKITDEADLREVSEISARESGAISISGDFGKPICFNLFGPNQTLGFLETMEERLGPDWETEKKSENILWGAAKSLLVTTGFVAFFVVMYVLIENGTVGRTHWLIALVVNIFGPFSLLVFAGISLLIGILITVMAIAKPAQYWLLKPRED